MWQALHRHDKTPDTECNLKDGKVDFGQFEKFWSVVFGPIDSGLRVRQNIVSGGIRGSDCPLNDGQKKGLGTSDNLPEHASCNLLLPARPAWPSRSSHS